MAIFSEDNKQDQTKLVHDGSRLEYEYRRSTRGKRRIMLSIGYDGKMTFTIPALIVNPTPYIDSFIQKHLTWIIKRLNYASTFKDKIILKTSRIEYNHHKERAKSLIEERLIYFNTFYNLNPRKITIKKMKSRWGSCSKQGNLNFNYVVALLPSTFADYIIVHELCHLGEFNHSKNFWNLVKKTIPDYKKIRKALKSTYLII